MANGTLTVRVRDADTLRPIVGALVKVNQYTRTSTVEGLASFVLAYGTYTLKVSRFDYQTGSWSVTVGTAAMEFDAKLTRLSLPPINTGVLYGQVREAETLAPIQGALLTVAGKSMYTDYQGYYAFTLSYGTYTLRVSKSGYATQSLDISISSIEVMQNFDLVKAPPAVPSGLGILFLLFLLVLLLGGRKE